MQGNLLAPVRRLLLAFLPMLAVPGIAGAAEPISPAVLPAIALRAADGAPSSLADWTEKPMVLNLWATWCPPCRKEMPALQALAGSVEAHGVRVVLLSLDHDVNLMEEFLLKYGITLPSPVAESPSDVYRELDAIALPVTFYVKAGGRIVGKHLGARVWDAPDVVAEVISKLAPQHSAKQSSEAPR